MSVTIEPLRLLAAFGLVLTYVAMCLSIGAAQIRKRREAAQGKAEQDVTDERSAWIVASASQTGTVEELAQQTAATLRLAGVPVSLCSLSDLDTDELARAERILFLTSTYGEGDPPDEGAVFATRMMGADASTSAPLAHLHYAVLACGDRSYANFCGFGRVLDQWLRRQGAQALFDRIEVDRCDPAAIETWRQRLSHIVGTSDAPDWTGPAFDDWRLVERRLLNPGSVGEPVYHLELEPIDAVQSAWQSGDLAQVLAPDEPDRPREYSIASIAEDGRVHLLIRLHRHPDGSPGVTSGWLTLQAALGSPVKMRLRQHRRFQLENNASRPLLLIGNGTGIAGLRSHLKARASSGATPNWLIFGERNAAYDFHYREEIEAWKASGVLEYVDLAFSRDHQERIYVQNRLSEARDRLRAWVAQGAAIYICGSLRGMASGVDAVLAEILGRKVLDELGATGRYRRDVY